MILGDYSGNRCVSLEAIFVEGIVAIFGLKVRGFEGSVVDVHTFEGVISFLDFRKITT
jgi:hypothetical protein